MLSYYTRIFQAYLGRGNSHLSFWHETPAVNEAAFEPGSWQYPMTFANKACYAGPFDDRGVPLLDYRGKIGRQFNPIAIAQYGLAWWNAADGTQSAERMAQREEGEEHSERNLTSSASFLRHAPCPMLRAPVRFLACADWLVDNLEPNAHGVPVWMHKFDWEYFQTLRAPWYSGLAQGQGISLLVRAHVATGEARYMEAAKAAFRSLVTPIEEGGCLFVDDAGDWWIEEYITDPPTHILNGFLWALWGVADWLRIAEKAQGSRFKGQGSRDGDSEGSGNAQHSISNSQYSVFGVQGSEAGRAKLPLSRSERAGDAVQDGLKDSSRVSGFRFQVSSVDLWERSLLTLEHNLGRFDRGYWSLYDLAPVGMRNVASPFYHSLHIVQMDVMWRMTGRQVFREHRDRWMGYRDKAGNRAMALAAKAVFKLRYY